MGCVFGCLAYCPRRVAKQTEDLEMVQSVVFNNSQDSQLNPFSSLAADEDDVFDEEGEEAYGIPDAAGDGDDDGGDGDLRVPGSSSHSFLVKRL